MEIISEQTANSSCIFNSFPGNPHCAPTAQNLAWRLKHNELTCLYMTAIKNGYWNSIDIYEKKLKDHIDSCPSP